MPAKRLTKARLNIAFEILVDDLANNTVHVPKPTVLCASGDKLLNIIDREQVDEEHHHMVATVQATSKLAVQENE